MRPLIGSVVLLGAVAGVVLLAVRMTSRPGGRVGERAATRRAERRRLRATEINCVEDRLASEYGSVDTAMEAVEDDVRVLLCPVCVMAAQW